MTASPQQRGLMELQGGSFDVDRLRLVAPACDCAIEPGPDAKLSWLCGTTIEQAATPADARDAAAKVLVTLNGLARMENPEHRNVELGNEFFKAGQPPHYFGPTRPHDRSGTFVFGSFLTGPVPTLPDPDRPRRARIAGDPKLRAIAEVFSEEVSWQKNRFALEKIWALVGSNEQALIRDGYVMKPELDRFNDSAHDPRVSGTNALHSYHPPRPPVGPPMTEAEGLAFIVQLLNTYVDKNP